MNRNKRNRDRDISTSACVGTLVRRSSGIQHNQSRGTRLLVFGKGVKSFSYNFASYFMLFLSQLFKKRLPRLLLNYTSTFNVKQCLTFLTARRSLIFLKEERQISA